MIFIMVDISYFCFFSNKLDHHVVQKISSEHVQWESEHTFKEHVVHRTEKAFKELQHFQSLVTSLQDVNTLTMMGGRHRLKHL